MKNSPIVERDMLDIIFAERNRTYGAYALRREYPYRLALALGAGLLLISASFAVPHILAAMNQLMPKTIIIDEWPPFMTPVEIPAETPPPVPPTPPPPPKAMIKFVPPIVDIDKEVTDPPVTIEMDSIFNAKEPIGSTTQAGEPTEPGDIPVNVKDLGLVEPARTDDNEVMDIISVQKMPSFPGGEAELMKFLAKNIQYPAIARENGIQGTVVLQFIIEKDGSIAAIQVLKEPGGGGLSKEAIRVIKDMPHWSPGEANGKSVRVKFTLPVKFRLD